jgi:hypothetical protein
MLLRKGCKHPPNIALVGPCFEYCPLQKFILVLMLKIFSNNFFANYINVFLNKILMGSSPLKLLHLFLIFFNQSLSRFLTSKNIILMYFQVKNILKNNCYHTPKHPSVLVTVWFCDKGYLLKCFLLGNVSR